jgi:hypothetical protein
VEFAIGRERHGIQDHSAGMVMLKFIFRVHRLFIPVGTGYCEEDARKSLLLDLMKIA